MSSAYELLGDSTFYRPRGNNRIRDVRSSQSAVSRMQQRLRDRKHRQRISVHQENVAGQREALHSFMVAPQYLNPSATKKLAASEVHSAKRTPVYQYSRITRPDTADAVTSTTVAGAGITAAVYVAHALEVISHGLDNIYKVVKEKIRFRGQAVNYSASEGATYSWWFGKTRAWARIAVPVLVAVALFVGILLTEKQANEPVAPKKPTVTQAETTPQGNAQAATATQSSGSNPVTTGNSKPAVTAALPRANSPAIGPQQAAGTAVTPNSSPTVTGGMGGGPSSTTNQGTVSTPQAVGTTTVSVPSQSIGVGDTSLVTTPSLDVTVN